jgi:phosphatidylinositol 4-kinase
VVALPFAVATPPAMVVGAEIWSWLLAEKSTFEVALMSEIVSSWSLTIKHEKGVFSQHIKLA